MAHPLATRCLPAKEMMPVSVRQRPKAQPWGEAACCSGALGFTLVSYCRSPNRSFFATPLAALDIHCPYVLVGQSGSEGQAGGIEANQSP